MKFIWLVFLASSLVASENKKYIALTFDDGPWPRITEQILDILDQYQIKATFFVLGSQVAKYPEILRDVAARGHAIGNHTYNHPDVTKISATELKEEILKTENLIDSISPGACSKFFRPPYFYIDRNSAIRVSKLGYWLVFHTNDPADWDQISEEEIVRQVIKQADQRIEVVVLHDGGGTRVKTVKALPTIIEKLKEKGYEFVTIPEIFGK